MKKYIHIVGAGGVAGIGMMRALQKEQNYVLSGHDNSDWAELVIGVPQADPWMADLVLSIPDKAVASHYGESDISFCPDQKQIVLCQNKAETAKTLGKLAPITYWVRDTQGAGGKGAQMASEFLPGRNISCEFCYFKNKLIGYFMKERLAYDIKGSKEPLKQMGSSVVSICIRDDGILSKGLKALQYVKKATETLLHGFYGIDFKQNEKGEFKITEINAGRLLTASYTYFYLTDYNLPLAGVKAYFGETYTLGEYPEGCGVIRMVDSLPRLFNPEETKKWKK